MSEITNMGFEGFLTSEKFFDYSDAKIQTVNEPLISESHTQPPKQEEKDDMSLSDYLVAFSTKSQSYCVGYVDMVNSTKISASLGMGRASKYYQIFLNSMSRILARFGGSVIKNVGDSLLYYFPESGNSERKYGFVSCLEGNLAMIEAHDFIAKKLHQEGLPPVDYRISADYGNVILMQQNHSQLPDLMGPPVNICSKINRMAGKNGFVIGGDLYQMVKTINDYKYLEIQGHSSGFKYTYPVYLVRRKE